MEVPRNWKVRVTDTGYCPILSIEHSIHYIIHHNILVTLKLYQRRAVTVSNKIYFMNKGFGCRVVPLFSVVLVVESRALTVLYIELHPSLDLYGLYSIALASVSDVGPQINL